MALGLGSIAFVGFNYGQNQAKDDLAFVTLADIPAGTVIQFSNGAWQGDSFSSSGSMWSWTATNDVPAGTIVTMEMPDGVTPTSNLGDITVPNGNGVSLGASWVVYAYVGAPDAPDTFLSAIASNTFEGHFRNPATLDGTDLTEGLNAIALGGIDIAVYNGARLGSASPADYLPLINDPANWVSQNSSGDLTQDGIAPDLPFSLAGFSADPNVQVVNFAADSLAVSQAECDSGETILTFTVERSGNTADTLNFSGTIEIGGMTRADDFGVTAPVSFTGMIEAGQASGTVIVRVSGDTLFEQNENFTLSLQSVSNDGVHAVLGEDTIATGTIANDDPAPASIAFVAFNAEGTDNLGFMAVSDIAANTTIHFANVNWAGSEFSNDNSNQGDAMWSWTAGSDIAAGTVITMDGLNSGAATSKHGAISFTSPNGTELDDQTGRNLGERVYAYLGTPEEPTAFLTAITTRSFGQRFLEGTALTEGVDALGLLHDSFGSINIAQYQGPRTGESGFEDYVAHINNPANWVIQANIRGQDASADGIFPDAPFQALPFSIDPTAQIVQFADGSLSVTQNEGETGTETAFTFTVERSGAEGDLSFSVRVPGGSYSDAANAADFGGGALPAVSGTIPDGESATTVTILVKGEHLYEVDERFQLILESASNPDASSVVIGNNSIATVTISNDDTQPTRVLAGEHHTATIRLTSDAHFVIEEGGSTGAISWRGEADIVIDNGGETGSITASGGSGGSVTINNLATGVIRGVVSAEDAGRTDYTLNNAGRIELAGDRMDLRDPADDGAAVVVNNLAGGVILQTDASEDIMRPGDENAVINNYGSILHAQGIVGGSSDGIQADSVEVNNYAGGLIEASRHAVTGDANVSVYNEGTMIGRNGSAVNIDNNGTEAERVFVTNHGSMEGRSANLADSDGDAVDVDGLLTLENYGFIGGMGHNGRHDGEPNVSEAVAIGGGTITNHAGGEIYGYGRAIQVDNSSNENALGATTIVNAGLIHGDGNLPTGVTPEEVEQFAERIRGGEAINLLGDYGDSLTNSGQIVGGVKMGGGDDVVSNSGAMAATGGSAVDLGEGDDTFEAHAGSTVDGLIDGGGGEDTLKLVGPGVGSLGENANFETLDIQSGIWSLESDAYDAVNVATGAMATSQLRLAEQGALTMAAGATLLVTSGDDAVVAEGAAGIENAGLIQALGMSGAEPAKAVVTNGGEVHNAAGGVILAQGAAIASGDAATAGVNVVNEGMIQSMSGEAIALSGEQNDSVTNQGVISGNVDLGAGDDMLNVHTTSSIAGAIEGGEGEDAVNLLGAGNGSLGAASGFENLNVQSGTWSVADGAVNFSDIVIEDGATVDSQIVLSNADMLTIEGGGALDTTTSREFSLVMTGGSVLDNAGTIRAEQLTIAVDEGTSTELGGGVTITNRAGGVIESADNRAIQINGNLNGETFAVSNAGRIESGDHYAIDFRYGVNGHLVLDNLAGGVIQTYADEDVIRGGDNLTINNAGTIANAADEPGESGGDAIDLQSETGGVVNNLAGGVIEGSRHAVTGEESARIVNEAGATMIGRNGSAVNFDNSGDAEDKVFVTNHGLMEGRSAETSDSDGDAVDVDGLVQVLNYGRIAGLGAEGYHDGEPNVSEAIAIGGGTILNYGADAEIYGYGRAIQVDNSSNENALGKTLINNDGLIQGDGHGPEGVDPQDAAQFDLRGNEAINLVGDYDDEILNQSTGRIVGGVSMGGGNDRMNNSGSITATGGSAINMGVGNDHLNLYVGATVLGTILLGAGDDLVTATSGGDFEIDGGEGDDEIYMASAVIGGDDIVDGGAGNDRIYGGLGEDRIAGGAGDDELVGEAGDDLIEGGDGGDTIDGGDGDDVLFGDDGDDTITASAGDDMVKGNDGDDVFLVAGLDDGRDQYDGGDGVDTLDFSMVSESVNLVLKDGVARSAGDKVENIENVTGGEAADRFTGNSLDNMLLGNAGDDTLNGRVGDDGLDGGAGNDKLIGAAGNDKLDGGEGDDDLNGGRGDDYLVGGLGDDMLKGAAGDDVLVGGAGGDTLTGGGGHDRFVFNSLGDGIDTITDFRLNGRSADQFVFSASMFEGFTGDDAFDLIGSGFLQAVDGSCGSTFIQVDADGGGDAFQTLACVNGNISNGMLADRAIVDLDPVA